MSPLAVPGVRPRRKLRQGAAVRSHGSAHGWDSGREVRDFLDWVFEYEKDGLVVVLKAGIDESGTGSEFDVLCVAAAAGSTRQWQHFMDEWNPVLAGLPPGKTFHAVERRRSVNEALAALTLKWMKFAFAITISKTEYQDETDQLFRGRYGSEYSMGIMACVQYLAAIQRRRQNKGRTLYAIERGHKNQGGVEKILDDLAKWRSERYLIKKAVFVPKDDPLVHPSDLISHEFASAADGRPSPVFETLKPHVAHLHVTRQQITQNVAEMQRLMTRFRYRQPGSRKPPHHGSLG